MRKQCELFPVGFVFDYGFTHVLLLKVSKFHVIGHTGQVVSSLYLIQFLLKEVLGTYIFVTRFLKTKHLLCFQGNGHERDFMDDKRVYIMDVYNRGIYPHDGYAKRNALMFLYNVTSHI